MGVGLIEMIGFLIMLGSGDLMGSEPYPLDKVLLSLHEMNDELNLTQSDLDHMVVVDYYRSRRSGLTHVYFRQTYSGIEVYNGLLQAAFDSSGALVTWRHRFVPLLQAKATALTPLISPEQAVHIGAQYLGYSSIGPLAVIRDAQGPSQQTLFAGGSLSETDIPVELMFLPLEDGRVALVWQMALLDQGSGQGWSLRVDALNGSFLEVHSRSSHDGYRVFPFPYASPNQPGAAHELVFNPASRKASPLGWHDVTGLGLHQFTTAQGNNVSVTEDTDANNHSGFTVEGGPDRLFDFPLKPGSPLLDSSNQKAAMTNLFFWCNILHDLLYIFGFDEESGNFQENNFQYRGLGEDRLVADSQDGAGVNNATFFTPPDGQKPRLQMFLFTDPDRDSSLDASIIIHEYAHGLSNRLVGGPSSVDCLFGVGRSLGEGWSDWWSLALTAQPGDSGATPRSIGSYSVGGDYHGSGIRNLPYSTDQNINNLSFGDISHLNKPHGTGEVWAVALWEVFWDLVDLYGFDPDLENGSGGNVMALQMVMDSFKLMPCGPTYLQARDAVLLADEVLFEGIHRCLIWKAFARRGMGVHAEDNDDPLNFDVVESFDPPPECVCSDPAPPQSLSVDAVEPNLVEIEWSPVPGVLGYQIYKAIGRCPDPETDAPFDILFGGNRITDNQVSGGLNYFYRVTALDATGYCESVPTSCESVVPEGSCVTPPVFEGVTQVSNGASQHCGLVISWAPATAFCGQDIVYNVYRSTQPDFEPSAFNRIASCLQETAYVDNRIEFLVPYYYIVRAENNLGRGVGGCTGFEEPNLKIMSGFATGTISDWILDSIQPEPASWLAQPGPTGGGSPWIHESLGVLSSPLAWFCNDDNLRKDQTLLYNQPIDLPANTSNFLSFWHQYHTELRFDGGVLEYSTNLGAAWFDILQGDGQTIPDNPNRFRQNGYDDVLSISSALSERQAWTGQSGGYRHVVVDMSDFAGQTLMLRWRMGTDSSVGREGWWVDDIHFYGYEDCAGFCSHLGALFLQWPDLDIGEIVQCVSAQ